MFFILMVTVVYNVMLKTKPILKEPARERKHQDGVANQLARRAPKKGEIVAHFVPETVNVDETIKEIKAKQKPSQIGSCEARGYQGNARQDRSRLQEGRDR
jgi:hypothetical protein